MTREELLAMLQEKGMDDNAIKALLEETLSTLGRDFEEHAEKEVFNSVTRLYANRKSC